MSRYTLFGIYEYESEETENGTYLSEHKIALATFDEIEDAQEYVEASKTNEYQEYDERFRNDHVQFKENSLLHGYVYYEIEECDDLPNNPSIK